MSKRLDKLRRLQEALDAMWAAAREADSAFNTDEASDLQSVIDEQDEEIARLKAENERLRKAGDAMADYIKGYSIADKQDYPRQVFDWLDAKEVQS